MLLVFMSTSYPETLQMLAFNFLVSAILTMLLCSPSNHYRAEYDFNARTELELTVRRGDILKVIMQHDVDNNPEWWLCAAHGKQGYIPSNYLTKAEYL